MKMYSTKGKLISALSLLMLSSGIAAYAIPADPRPKTFVQPDGQCITVKIRGDERHHIYLTDDDFLLYRDGDAFYYGDVDASGCVVSSGILASMPAKRTAPERSYLSEVDMTQALERLSAKSIDVHACAANRPTPQPQSGVMRAPGLFPDASFPVKGEQKVLVVLVEYTDVKFNLDDPYDYFYRLLNEDGFSDYGGTGSAAQYFRDNSGGQFDPKFDVYGPITLAHNRSYYGGNDIWGNDQRPEEMAIEACQQLDEQIDFNDYDRNGDGYIDNVYIYYAGAGEATGGSSNTVWPHSWNVTYATSTPYYFDGVRLDRYGCSNEWESYQPDGIGTFVHEFSHVMGLPDLYATSYTSAFTPSAWSALDYGPYNNNGCTPPNYGAFERYALEWMEPTVIDGPLFATLDNVTTNQAYIINTPSANEYFLLENRQQHGWDAYIPGHGMLIWHIDYKASVWDSNTVNNDPSHQYVDIEEADNNRTEYTRDGDPFPGSKNVTSFTDTTQPSMKTWSGKPLGLPITHIQEADGVITFRVAGGVSSIDPIELYAPTKLTPLSFDISWSSSEYADRYYVNVYTKDEEGNVTYLPDWNRHDVGNVNYALINDLTPNTLYYCTVVASNGTVDSPESNEVAVTTAPETYDMLTPTVTEATNVDDKSFVANWLPVPNTTSYFIDVYTKGNPQLVTDVCDFTGGLGSMPAGWSTNSRATYANTAYCGQAVPAVRLGADEAYVATPIYDGDVVAISFWQRGSTGSESSRIIVKGLIDESYVELANLPVVTVAGGGEMCLDSLPAGVKAISIEYAQHSKSHALAIDDICVTWGGETPIVLLEPYDRRDVGDALSCLVEGLAPNTTYYYRVIGYNGITYTHLSDEMAVTTDDAVQGLADALAQTRAYTIGDILTVNSLPGESVCVTDVMGRVIATAKTDAMGLASIPLPGKGVYVLRVASVTYKIKN